MCDMCDAMRHGTLNGYKTKELGELVGNLERVQKGIGAAFDAGRDSFGSPDAGVCNAAGWGSVTEAIYSDGLDLEGALAYIKDGLNDPRAPAEMKLSALGMVMAIQDNLDQLIANAEQKAEDNLSMYR